MLCVMKGIFTSRPVATTLSIFRTNSSITGVLIELISRNSRNMLIVILIGLCENLKSIEWIWAEWWPWIELKRQPNASDLTHARYEAGYYRFHWSICVEKTHPLQRRAPPLNNNFRTPCVLYLAWFMKWNYFPPLWLCLWSYIIYIYTMLFSYPVSK